MTPQDMWAAVARPTAVFGRGYTSRCRPSTIARSALGSAWPCIGTAACETLPGGPVNPVESTTTDESQVAWTLMLLGARLGFGRG